MDREREAGILTASGAGLIVVAGIIWWAWKKKHDGSQQTPNTSPGTSYPQLNHNYEVSDDGLLLTSYTNGSTRGWRNHNPLNIVISGNNWIGKVTPNTDGKFEQFVSNIYGFRAALKNLQSYIRNGYNTIPKIVDRWSGKSNNTTYANYVVNNTTLNKDTVIAADDYQALMELVYAMAMMENGTNPMPDEMEVADAAILVYNGY